MILELQIKLRSNYLGNKNTPELIRRFQCKRNELCLDLPNLHWLMEEAAKDLRMPPMSLSSVRFPQTIRKPTFVTYVRKFTKDGKRHEERFEAIPENTVLTIPIVIPSKPEAGHPREGDHIPTPSEFRALMTHIGSMYGISPWGSKFGYGRFIVLSLKLQ